MITVSNRYLGVSVASPIVIQKGSAALASGVDAVRASIFTLLSTPVNTRFMNPGFGSRLHELIFEPNDTILKNLLTDFIREAIDAYEPRANLVKVGYEINVDEVICEITVSINDSLEETFVYPFYRKTLV